MGGASLTAKYHVSVYFEVDGIVEKPDVIGAIFGQTEGLLGDELDLRELQRTGRIGRIQVKLSTSGGKTTGEITIPSSLDKIETALMAAAIEAIDKVGPCSAKFHLKKVEDLRDTKRDKVIERAKEILRKWESEKIVETREIIDKIMKEIRTAEIIKFGEEKLPAGPDVPYEDTIMVVEGRADVLNLLKYGYKNAIAIEGTSIPKTIATLTKKKKAIAFVDGDRAGELILRELKQEAKRAAELIKKHEFIRIITHHDVDGISSAAILAISLLRIGKKFRISFLKGLNQDFDYLGLAVHYY